MSTETFDSLVRIGLSVSIPLAGLLIVVPRLGRQYCLAPWAKVALWTASLTLLIWSALGFVQAPLSLSHPQGIVAFAAWMFTGGFSVGIFFALVFSRALSKKLDDEIP